MASSLAVTCALVGAGALAGVLGTAGGITSLVSYPALLAVGVPPVAADIANLVALVACWPGSALTSRTELTGTRAWLSAALPVAAAGAALGSWLLLTTPAGLFGRVVPFLVLAGSLALLLQPVASRRGQASGVPRRTATVVLLGVLSVYGGYFGAGAGVMTLVVVLVLVDQHLPRANAAKNMVVGASALASAVLLVLAGPVDWSAVAPLAAGLFAGSTVGPVLARRLPAPLVRWAVAALGAALAVELWIDPR